MGETAEQAEQRFERCSQLIARQRANCAERAAMKIAGPQWIALTQEFGELQNEINRLLGDTP